MQKVGQKMLGSTVICGNRQNIRPKICQNGRSTKDKIFQHTRKGKKFRREIKMSKI